MSKPTLTTEFVKIGQSGKTIDGRNIAPAWLLQAAETYSTDTYTALIWPDHFRFQNYGKVLELRTEEEGGVVSLFARLQPNAQYMWDNRNGQRLFFSMEIAENFAGSGKAYLVGLGITDTPASLGTDELKFAARHTVEQSRFLSNTECTFPSADDSEPSWFSRFRQKFFTTNPEEPMDAKQFNELTAKVDAIGATVEKLEGSLAKFAAPPAADGATAPADQASAPAPAQAPAAPAPDAFAQLNTAVTGLEKKLDDLAARFAAPKPGTTVPTGEGPAEDKPLF